MIIFICSKLSSDGKGMVVKVGRDGKRIGM
jgi:hypothetical protein